MSLCFVSQTASYQLSTRTPALDGRLSWPPPVSADLMIALTTVMLLAANYLLGSDSVGDGQEFAEAVVAHATSQLRLKERKCICLWA